MQIHLEAKRYSLSTYLMPAGYLITLCWLCCQSCYHFAGFWESALHSS